MASPQLRLSDWLPALPPYLPLPRWVVRLMLRMAPVSPLEARFEVR
jgi:hypothetical protein